MKSVGAYVLSVTAAGVICGLVTAILGEKSPYSGMIKMLAGIFLAIAVVSPLTDIRLDFLDGYIDNLKQDGDAAVQSGIQKSEEAIGLIIKSKTEAYILDKAEALGADIEVDVTVSGDYQPIPKTVCIAGSVSPYAKARLENMLEEDLGIGKEGQLWIG